MCRLDTETTNSIHSLHLGHTTLWDLQPYARMWTHLLQYLEMCVLSSGGMAPFMVPIWTLIRHMTRTTHLWCYSVLATLSLFTRIITRGPTRHEMSYYTKYTTIDESTPRSGVLFTAGIWSILGRYMGSRMGPLFMTTI